MKILLTTDTYYPMINGVVISTSNLYKELKEKGHQVRILTLSHTGEERTEGDIYYLKSLKINVYPDARIKVPFYNKLIKEIIEWHPDIVHSQTEFSTMIVAKHIAKKLDIPQVHTYHTMYEDYLGYILGGKVIRKGGAAKVTKFILDSVDEVIAPTDKTKTALREYGLHCPINIIPTGIDLGRFQKNVTQDEKEQLLLKLGLSDQDKIMTYVGRIAEEKNIDEIIGHFPEILEKVPKAKLLIVGAGPHLEVLKELAKEKALEESIIFTGMVEPTEVYKYYKIADVFVTASTSETQGLTYIEALSCGCPIVCRYDKAIDGVILQGTNGFSYKNSWEFILYASEVLANDELKEELSRKAMSKANEYSSKTFAGRVEDLYVKAVSYGETYNSGVRASGLNY
ncbi:glycosyltransferase family 4 protein [Clostridium tunisiense]|uniref:glycosyltransferase family 4 protein n=1 Tax=Clostridium tunisiense TaxID=219748 RepID=UPI0002DEC0EB|nr:glycosyltransferase family 4 protein [Clostridium tunisiense]